LGHETIDQILGLNPRISVFVFSILYNGINRYKKSCNINPFTAAVVVVRYVAATLRA